MSKADAKKTPKSAAGFLEECAGNHDKEEEQ